MFREILQVVYGLDVRGLNTVLKPAIKFTCCIVWNFKFGTLRSGTGLLQRSLGFEPKSSGDYAPQAIIPVLQNHDRSLFRLCNLAVYSEIGQVSEICCPSINSNNVIKSGSQAHEQRWLRLE